MVDVDEEEDSIKEAKETQYEEFLNNILIQLKDLSNDLLELAQSKNKINK